MSIELKQAAQQALDAFDAFGEDDDFESLFALSQKMEALRTAIQQAEAQQPSSKEHLFELWWEAHMPNATQEQAWTAFTAAVASNGVGIAAQQPATGEPVGQVSDLFPSVRNKLHAQGFDSDAPLYTHPAPSLPGDVVRDAERYRWLRSTTNAFTNSKGERIDVKLNPEVWDEAIDAAMLAAKEGGAA